jgi:hypothetical protein
LFIHNVLFGVRFVHPCAQYDRGLLPEHFKKAKTFGRETLFFDGHTLFACAALALEALKCKRRPSATNGIRGGVKNITRETHVPKLGVLRPE